MTIIDSDDPNQMAVFPKGEKTSGSQPEEEQRWGGRSGVLHTEFPCDPND